MKSSIFFLIVCLSFFFKPAISQPVAPSQRNKADSLMNEGNVPEAIAEYKRLYILNPKDQQIVYNYACALSVDNSVIKLFDSCFKYLNIAVELDTSVTALTDPTLIPARENKKWDVFENKLISMLNIKYDNPYKDVEYAKALWRLGAYDQAYFNEIGITGRKFGMRSSVSSAIWKLKFMIQEKNQRELEQLVAVKAWPKISEVGRPAAMSAYLVAMHTNDGSQKKYLPMIKQKCEENELPWQRYANIYDRCLFNENKPQKYGTHTRFNEQTKSEELYPLEDETKVDEWRKELGLEPLAEYLARLNIKFQPKQE
jgi:tetratricopeptide (TPR) repeat protein